VAASIRIWHTTNEVEPTLTGRAALVSPATVLWAATQGGGCSNLDAMDTIILGPARIGDAGAMANLSRTAIEAGLPWSWTTPRVAAHMRNRDNLVVTAKSGTALAGFVIAHFGDAAVHLSLLGVAKPYRGLGIGRQLVEWVEASAVTAGIFTVNLEVRQSNTLARRFYARMGYKEQSKVPGYYSGVEDAVNLSHDLRVTAR
jgi:ribosomal-protein-alanine N-acetyltransferase